MYIYITAGETEEPQWTDEQLDATALELATRHALKPNTSDEYRSIIALMSEKMGPPPYNPEQVRRYLTTIFLQECGKTTGDKVRRAVQWWHSIHDEPNPCNPSVVRLCDGMHRSLPAKGPPPKKTVCRRRESAVDQPKQKQNQDFRRRLGPQYDYPEIRHYNRTTYQRRFYL